MKTKFTGGWSTNAGDTADYFNELIDAGYEIVRWQIIPGTESIVEYLAEIRKREERIGGKRCKD